MSIALSRSRLLRSPFLVFYSLLRHRHLIVQMSMQEVRARYSGSVLGIVWSFFNPLLQLTVYTFVFGYIFQARWGMATGDGGFASKLEFAVILFTGLILHSFFAECINRAPGLMQENANLVKRVVFPLEVLPWVAVGSALFHLAVGFCVLAIGIVVVFGTVHWTAILVVLPILSLLLIAVGATWFLASIGVFFRDIGQAMGPVTMILLFVSPILFPVDRLPETFRFLLLLNPLTIPVEQARAVLLWGELPNWLLLGQHFAVGLVIAWIGYYWFARTHKAFADVI
ncbi:ABC transporter permease [Oceanibaculum pacificum]|uniref:ABC transporter permease n=1 Tax=Oceanibaculum pacificum TaxID=580166 RepID=UPI000AEC6BC1|nr:ABC transporter permease [Oceanibaculum pacificum]